MEDIGNHTADRSHADSGIVSRDPVTHHIVEEGIISPLQVHEFLHGRILFLGFLKRIIEIHLLLRILSEIGITDSLHRGQPLGLRIDRRLFSLRIHVVLGDSLLLELLLTGIFLKPDEFLVEHGTAVRQFPHVLDLLLQLLAVIDGSGEILHQRENLIGLFLDCFRKFDRKSRHAEQAFV